MKPNVSVIIPVYNTEKLLSRCLQSVTEQSLTNIEIICVNDGSTDNSLDVLQKWADKDNRIIVINQANGRQGKARNAAMAIAKGEYIGMIDSDDYIPANYFEKLYNAVSAAGGSFDILDDDIDNPDYGNYQPFGGNGVLTRFNPPSTHTAQSPELVLNNYSTNGVTITNVHILDGILKQFTYNGNTIVMREPIPVVKMVQQKGKPEQYVLDENIVNSIIKKELICG